MLNSLDVVTIGELIKEKREELGIKLSELSRRTGINKGIISKIESGETKRPELRTLKPIADVLNIPYEEIIEWYIKVEDRYGMFYDFLMEVAETSNLSLMEKVAVKFLENPNKDTYELLENIFKIAETFENTEVRLTLYNVIIKYARTHGVPKYIAKGLYQKYLIERADLKRLEESFKVGEEVLHYVEFLSDEEKIIFYFRMTLHAHNIKKYPDCIELCNSGIALEKNDTELKARAYLAMINSLSNLGDYSKVELHLETFKKLKHDFVDEATKLESAIVKAKKKEFHQAIPLLKESLQEISEQARIHVVNELLEIYFELEDLDAISEIFAKEEKLLFSSSTPYKLFSLGRYYIYKGNYQVSIGLLEDSIDSYINSIKAYGEICSYQEIVECMNVILSKQPLHSQSTLLFEKLKKVYNGIIDK
ncbi:transcriptional regulator [Brevibacillus laterosporus]|uniref:helix-turn-helix domain-containing protein n=1 Tax=Brevibacillus laterosporus TaxID=1465 RepID=UPI000CE3E92F|nr:helix-turn-helix domain-containing protein [Brevibacillus laterosporus]PPA80808.1 transcriptional regulator [Brevibacillus laterosporus]